MNLHTSSRCDYTSEFSDVDSEAEFQNKTLKKKNQELYKKPFLDQKLGLFRSTGDKRSGKPASKRFLADELDREEGKRMRYHGILAMDAFTRHQKFVNDYLTYYGGKKEDFIPESSKTLTDRDIIEQNNRFLWDKSEDSDTTWEKKLAKKYWDKLFKEYAITDLSRFKENKVALRWRIEKEVVSGKGQFSCGNKHCKEDDGLRSWEVNFAYVEDDEKKNALVKLRLCAECSYKLNYHHKRKEVKAKKMHKTKKDKKEKKLKHKRKREMDKDEKPGTSSYEKEAKQLETDIWSQPIRVEHEKSREDEFDSYFDDMFQ